MKRFLLISLLAVTGLTSQAQPNVLKGTLTYQSETTGVKEYAKSVGPFVARPDVKTDKKTKKTTAVWHSTNNDWIKDYCEPKDFTIEKDYLKIFPNIAHMQLDDQPFVPMSWRLTGENNETVLHCYFRMPADEVTNLWLTSEETCLVNRETGAQYRIRRTEPDTFRKHFTVRAKKGDVIDLKIFFPPLPETTKDITIFGIPNWYLVGDDVSLRQTDEDGMTVQGLYYDTIPQLRKPRLLQEHLSEDKPYDKQNWNTWKVLTDAHLIKPLKDGTMALWLTPDATYIAFAFEQNWTREYWGFDWGNEHADMLVDEAGRQYKLREVQGVPQNEIFFMEGKAGDYLAYLKVFDPLPLEAKTFTYIVPEGEPFNAWGANWSGKVLHNLDIQELRDNQKLFNYHPRIIVK
jgi:hypothetical protein